MVDCLDPIFRLLDVRRLWLCPTFGEEGLIAKTKKFQRTS